VGVSRHGLSRVVVRHRRTAPIRGAPATRSARWRRR